MNEGELSLRLSRIKTHWSALLQAHGAAGDAATAAQRELLLNYYGAVYRYLLAPLGDADVAEELTQEFAVRFLRGDFRRAAPERGRFRDFLKVSVRHLMLDHWRKKGRGPADLPGDAAAPAAAGEDLDRPFLEKWREELLALAWKALREVQEQAGLPYYAALRLKTERPELRSGQLAEQLGAQLGKRLTEDGARQLLHRARQKFADLLVAEVARSLTEPTPEELEQELIDLELLVYCRSALQRRGRPR
jgi:RNA polymerase sigma-70 factor (ECF subfamily)